MHFLSYIVILGALVLYLILQPIKVCENFTDYLTIDFNSRCFPNPDVDAIPEDIALNNGYFLQRIELISLDGYDLDLFHVVKNCNDIANDRPPILIQHSILSSVKSFMANGKKSMTFAFLDKGYDVWLSSFRGILRKGHVNMSFYDPDYWKFGYYEMAINDIPVFIEYVRKHNKSPQKLIFLGHAQGSTLGYIYSSMKPEEAQDNLKAIFSLGSFAFANYSKSPFVRMRIMKLFGYFGTNFFTKTLYDQILMSKGDKLLQFFCYSVRNMFGCKIIMDLFFNGAYSEFDAEHFPTFVYSVKPIAPYIAKDIDTMYATGRFEGRNYRASDVNPQIIEYKLENIRVPVYIFEVSNDAVSDLDDAKKVFGKLINSRRKLIIVDENFPVKLVHTDTFVGKGMEIFSKRIIEELDKI